jgi:hypothetical protein
VNKKICFIFGFVLFFVGCGDKSGVNINAQTQQAIVSTKKVRVEAQDRTALLLTATYMNNIKKYSKEERDIIILSSYYSPSTDDMPNVTLNGKTVEILQIDSDNDILKDLPSRNIWSRYYKIETDKDKKDTLLLTVEIRPFPQVLLELSKEL